MEQETMPTWAERARTAVACARAGALTTYPRQRRPMMTTVLVSEDAGRMELRLPADSAAARTLAVRPVATVRVAPPHCEVTTVLGAVRRLPGRDGDQRIRFLLDAGAVRVGSTCHRVLDADAYRAAEPDPLRDDAPCVLAHLRGEHAAALADCLRAQGHAGVRWVEPTGLDRYGLDLTGVDDDGVGEVRLPFPAPVRSLRELAPHLYLALRGRCADCRTPDHRDPHIRRGGHGERR